MAPASVSDDQSISSSSHRRIQSTSNSHGHLAAAPPLHHHTHPHPYYAQDIKQTASPSTIFSTFEGYSRPTSPVWEVSSARETEQDSRSQIPASASSESAICIPSGSTNVWPRSTLEVEGEELEVLPTLDLNSCCQSDTTASEAKPSDPQTCSGFIDRTAEEAQNPRPAALEPTTTSNAITTASIAREQDQENMGTMYVHPYTHAPSGSQSRAHAHYKDKEVHMQKQDGSTQRSMPRPTCTAFIGDQEKSRSSAWPLSNTSASTYTDLSHSTRSDGIQVTGQAGCSCIPTLTAEAEELQRDLSTTRAASDAVKTDLDSDRLSSSGRQRISASHPSSSRSTSTIYDRRHMHHKCTHASEVSANLQLNQHSQEETAPLSAIDEEITASNSKIGQRDQKTVDSLLLHLDGLGARKINDRTMVSSVFSVDENVVVDGDDLSISSPSQQSISTESSAPLLDVTIPDQITKEDDTFIRASSKNVISSSPKSLTFVTSVRNPAASTARTTSATTSSTVKASSPLRIITTPLPVTSDSDSSGAEAAPVGRSLTAASSIANVKLSNLTSISSSTSNIKYSKASGLGIIDTSATSESAPSSSSSMAIGYDSAITPTASPYSSIFTARSDWPSSVPTTANSAFPSGASYTSSACSCAVPTYNSLQLIQQQQQQQHKQYTRTSTETPSGSTLETYQADVNGRSETSHNNHNTRRSRYADFASPNIAANYDWFTQNCPPSNRPPLLRSVSEDTAPVYSSPTSNRTPSKSQFKQRGNAIGQLGPLHVGNADDRATSQTLNGVRHDSLQMGPRALTAPYFALSAAVEAGIDASRTGITNTAAPPSESSSRNASTSISSHSSFSTAPSSKRSSWCSPPALSGEPLPPISLSGRSTPISHTANATPTKVAGAPPFKPRHSASYSVNSALPLSRTNHAYQRASGDRRSTFPSPASSAPSSITDAGEKDATEIDSTLLASFDPAVAEAIRQAAATVRSQMGNVGTAGADGGFEAPKGFTGHQQGHFPPNSVHQSTGNLSAMQNSLMGACGNGYFGNAIRAKALEILDELLPSMAYAAEEDDVIGIAEYGSLNSLSSSLVPHITAHFSSSSEGNAPSFAVTYSDGPGSDFRSLMRQVDSTSYEYPYHHLNSNVYSSFAARPFPVQVVPPRSVTVGFSLMDLHCRRTPSSIGLSAAAAAHNELQAFLNTRAQEIKKGGLLLLAFIQRQEDESIAAVAAGKSKRAGDQESPEEPSFTSPIAAHLHGPLNHLATTQEKITSFKSDLPATLPVSFPPANVSSSLNSSLQTLSTSAESASTSASLLGSSASSSMSRRRSESSPCRPCFKTDSAAKRTDVWSTIPALLAPCIQRLVSTGLIKSDTASHLLTLPLHPRTPNQTRAVLRAVQHQWKTEWSCGLPEPSTENSGAASPSTPTPTSSFTHSSNMPESLREKLDGADLQHQSLFTRYGPVREEALTLSHPAYTAFQSTTLSRIQFAEHALQFIRVLYEAHFRTVLREHAKLSRSRLEEVLDALNEVLREKIEEPGRALLALELEVCMVALRRL